MGLGYVGLPVAVALAERLPDGHRRVVGFDIAPTRVAALRAGHDATREIDNARLTSCNLEVSDDPAVLDGASIIIGTVPTPITDGRRPDLTPLHKVWETIGPRLSKGALVVFESTLFPVVTEDICGPWLAEHSGLVQGHDFALGYSPERINPGDQVRRLETITKIVAADSAPAQASASTKASKSSRSP